MIIGTAGHIDHGKTALVQALTGVDTDRLEEEKARGISIALGYAYQALPNDEVLGFIDVPGHERLIHTMLAGAAGIDFLLLVVAADDGIMPQTLEHLQILELLGIAQGAVALTKIDRVDRARIGHVAQEIEHTLAGKPLAGLPIFPLSSVTGEGIDALRAHLVETAVGRPPRRADGYFRLAVDRSFSLRGVGTLVTGTVFAGSVEVGAELIIAPGGKRARLRGLHAQDRPATSGHAGQRCALNLGGVEKDAIARGDWIVAAPLCIPVERFDARLSLSAQARQPLRQWFPVHLHLGATHRMARLVLLEGERLAPGETALVQVVPERVIGALHGDRFIIRDAEARQTLGGGQVLDIFAPARKRRTPQRLAELSAMACDAPVERLGRLLEQAAWGLDLNCLQAAWNAPHLVDDLPTDARRIEAAKTSYAVAQSLWRGLAQRLLEGLGDYHERLPEELGPDAGRARRMWLPRLALPLFEALVAELIERGDLKRTGAWLHRTEHRLDLTDREQVQAEAILSLLRQTPLDPPWVRDIAKSLDQEEATVRQLMRKMGGQGLVFQIVRDLFFAPEALERLARIVRELELAEGGVRAATFRDRAGVGRKRAIQILEYFDRVGLTRRVRDLHRVRPDSPLGNSAASRD